MKTPQVEPQWKTEICTTEDRLMKWLQNLIRAQQNARDLQELRDRLKDRREDVWRGLQEMKGAGSQEATEWERGYLEGRHDELIDFHLFFSFDLGDLL